MATERLSMRQTREILRQKWSLGRTHREVAQSLGISSGAVGTTVLRARAAGLEWALVDTLSDDALQARVYGPPTPPTHHRLSFAKTPSDEQVVVLSALIRIRY